MCSSAAPIILDAGFQNPRVVPLGGDKIKYFFIGILFARVGRKVVRGERLREFNDALLGKWCWSVLRERGSFWYMLLAHHYSEERGG